MGIEIRGDLLTDKENAGAALLDAVFEVQSIDPVPIGSYRGLSMTTQLSLGVRTVSLHGEMTHSFELGGDPRGNFIRMENALDKIPARIKALQAKLDDLIKQQEAAQVEVTVPFPQEQELKEKTARLAELDIALNLDRRNEAEPVQDDTDAAKTARPSVLEKLKRPPVHGCGARKTTREMEER